MCKQKKQDINPLRGKRNNKWKNSYVHKEKQFTILSVSIVNIAFGESEERWGYKHANTEEGHIAKPTEWFIYVSTDKKANISAETGTQGQIEKD